MPPSPSPHQPSPAAATTAKRSYSRCSAVIFDLGQVLVAWDPLRAFVPDMDEAEARDLLQRIDFPRHNHRLDAGEDEALVLREVAELGPEHGQAFARYVERKRLTVTGPVPGSERIVQDLKAAGVSVFGLTNWAATDFHLAGQAAPAVSMLADVVVSGAEGIAKPDPRIFHLALSRFSLTPATTLFVDDSRPNVDAAAAIGLQVHHFVDATRLREELVARGMLPDETRS